MWGIEVTTRINQSTNIDVTEPKAGDVVVCVKCHGPVVYMVDKKLGYYKECTSCGHIEYLNRRFLRFDRHSRKWL
jgi:hypothetical protein